MRTFFVIDRRVVVDEAFDRPRRIRVKLREPGQQGILREVAKRLSLFGGEPLHVAVLRGGMYRDNAWAKSPTQPTVCISTVNQVGSRLLFRGYGVSEYQRAIHAGLVGNDSLIIVDEAHLSQPFVETLNAVRYYRSGAWAELAHPTPFEVVPPCQQPSPRRRSHSSSTPRRITRTKSSDGTSGPKSWPEELRSPRTRKKKTRTAEPSLLRRFRERPGSGRARHARGNAAKAPRQGSLSEPARPVHVVGIVVNRVATARMIFDVLHKDQDHCYAILLTGRIRPYDRDELLYRTRVEGREEGWFPYMEAASERPTLGKMLFVVATQTVEVGANFSFDALATEASHSTRCGSDSAALTDWGCGTSYAAIIARKDALGSEPDPIYGKATSRTWKWLKTQQTGTGQKAVIDFGLTALKPPIDAKELEALCCPRKSAPVLLPAHVDTWVQTSPAPEPDPDAKADRSGRNRQRLIQTRKMPQRIGEGKQRSL